MHENAFRQLQEENKKLLDERDQALKDLEEQCFINGKGAERESSLLAALRRAREAIAIVSIEVMGGCRNHVHVGACFKSIRDVTANTDILSEIDQLLGREAGDGK